MQTHRGQRETITQDQRAALGVLAAAEHPMIRLVIQNHADVGMRTFRSLVDRRLIREVGPSHVTGQTLYKLTPRGRRALA